MNIYIELIVFNAVLLGSFKLINYWLKSKEKIDMIKMVNFFVFPFVYAVGNGLVVSSFFLLHQ
jgi:hypothetical protein